MSSWCVKDGAYFTLCIDYSGKTGENIKIKRNTSVVEDESREDCSLFFWGPAIFSSYSSYVQAVYTSLAFAPHPSKLLPPPIEGYILEKHQKNTILRKLLQSRWYCCQTNRHWIANPISWGQYLTKKVNQVGPLLRSDKLGLFHQDTHNLIFIWYRLLQREPPKRPHWKVNFYKLWCNSVATWKWHLLSHICTAKLAIFATKYFFFNTRTFSIDAILLKCWHTLLECF